MQEKEATDAGEKTPEKETEENAGKEKAAVMHLEELREMLQRLQADFENHLKRNEKERQEYARYASAGVVKEILPVLDSFDSAIEKMEKQQALGKEEALHGIKGLRGQLMKVLERQGLKEIVCAGKPFDPGHAECLAMENAKEKPDGIVLEEIQKGYMFKDKVLRTAKVKVNKPEK